MVEAHIVNTFMIGNTQIKIADNNYQQKTTYDVEQLLAQIAKRAQRHFSELTSTESYGSHEDQKIPTYHGEYNDDVG